MNALFSFRLALKGLMINKARSVLTLLGIVIGIGAVITITALAEGLRVQASKQIDALGTNLMFVFPQMSPNQSKTSSARAGYSSPPMFVDKEVTAIKAALRVPTALSASVQKEANVSHGRDTVFVSVEGVDESYFTIYNLKLASGRPLSPSEISGGRRVALLGHQTAIDLFGDLSPIGQNVQIDRKSFQVVGVLKEKGGGMGNNPDKVVHVPLKVAQQSLFGFGNKVLFLTLQVNNINDMNIVKADVKRALNRIRRIKDSNDEDYGIISQTDALKQFGQFINILTFVFGGVAAISLLVGGIGIMNIMLVSVTERTREIGLRKAVGARQVDILLQFLIEAIVLCLMGGVIGMILGYAGAMGLSALIRNALPEAAWAPVISAKSVLIAVLFSTFIGLIFGVYPAANAARKDPILALRYE
jgi:putative ABC transport system permease protein